MPIKQSAKKALRQAKKRRKLNLWYKERLKKAWKTRPQRLSVAMAGEAGDLTQIYKAIDKSAKKGVIKPNKAARKKSQAAKLYSSLPKDQELGAGKK